MAGILVPIVMFLCIAAVLIVYFIGRHNERRALIEKGISPAELRDLEAPHGSRVRPLSSLKWGLLALFVGLGLLVGGLLYETYHFDEYIYFASMLISGGIGLVVFYRIASKKLENAA